MDNYVFQKHGGSEKSDSLLHLVPLGANLSVVVELKETLWTVKFEHGGKWIWMIDEKIFLFNVVDS